MVVLALIGIWSYQRLGQSEDPPFTFKIMPLADVERPLGTHTIIVPIANHDDRQHSFDENLRLQNLWDGIELMAALLRM